MRRPEETGHVAHSEADSLPADPPPNRIVRLARVIALGGGLLTLGIALLVTVSVIGRSIWGEPVPGDFEFVQMATAVTLFAFLPLCQSHRGNIAVDTFTNRLPHAWQRRLDVAWDLVYAVFMTLICVGLFRAALEAYGYGTTTMVLGLPIWPAIAVSALLCAMVALVALSTAGRLARGRT
jgi:TRAP-type C4-dicarboxylate transport system permease small subunit